MYLDRIVATKKEEVAALSSVFDMNEAEKGLRHCRLREASKEHCPRSMRGEWG